MLAVFMEEKLLKVESSWLVSELFSSFNTSRSKAIGKTWPGFQVSGAGLPGSGSYLQDWVPVNRISSSSSNLPAPPASLMTSPFSAPEPPSNVSPLEQGKSLLPLIVSYHQ